MFNQKTAIKVRAKKGSHFVEEFCKSFDEIIKPKFSNVYVSSDKVEIQNSFFSFLVIWNLYEIISSGTIATTKKNNLITISCEANYKNFIIFWLLMTALIVIGEGLYGFEDKAVFILPIVWGGCNYLLIQLSFMRFRSRVVESVKQSNGNIL